jgi:Spy/CpxP family protein refolding chaperone
MAGLMRRGATIVVERVADCITRHVSATNDYRPPTIDTRQDRYFPTSLTATFLTERIPGNLAPAPVSKWTVSGNNRRINRIQKLLSVHPDSMLMTTAASMIRLTFQSTRHMENMMKKRTWLGALGIAMIGILAAGFVCVAQGRGEGHGRGGMMGGDRGEMVGKAMERLNLTADQKARIKALRDGFQQANASTLAEVKALRDQMKSAMEAKDREKAKSIREQMKTKMETLKPAREQLHQQILAVLTAEQKAELEKMKADHKGRGDCKGKGKGKARGGQGSTGGTGDASNLK